jgi:hypothetical protein
LLSRLAALEEALRLIAAGSIYEDDKDRFLTPPAATICRLVDIARAALGSTKTGLGT